jgi:aspartate carbamoyltransferase catalytic subunit
MKHVISADQFNKQDILDILELAKKMDQILESGRICKIAEGKILATFFYEPSTRTRLSFETAMLRLGGGVISTSNVNFSSVTKGETIEDSAKVLAGYADIVALRSPEIGYAQRAADVSSIPILNGGDGAGEHPTQSFLDLYTISKHFDLEKPLVVSLVGELICGRTVHSLSKMLRNFPQVKINFVAPEEIQIPAKYFHEDLGDRKFYELNDEILETSDVIYDTRIQKERLDPAVYEKHKHAFHFDMEKVKKMKPEAMLMHPLPRVNEISPEVDNLSQAKYFEQAQNGVPTRMALIVRSLGLEV